MNKVKPTEKQISTFENIKRGMKKTIEKKRSPSVAEEEYKLEVLGESNSFLDKLDIKKRNFVLLYTTLYGHISDTCAGCRISRQTYYDWLDNDENFAKAIAEAEMGLNDEVRGVLINKIASGDMTAVIFYLKNRHPDFKQTPTTLVQINQKGEMDLEFIGRDESSIA